jgi:hypothetical protein
MNASGTRRFIQKIIASNGDVYRVLGLDAGADEDTLKKAYKRLALKVHPDKCLNEDLKSDCSIAFQILTKSYERARKARPSPPSPPVWTPPSPPVWTPPSPPVWTPPAYQENTPMTNAWNESSRNRSLFEESVPTWSPPLRGISTRPLAKKLPRNPFFDRPRPILSPYVPFGGL